jgi:hypothetical protein
MARPTVFGSTPRKRARSRMLGPRLDPQDVAVLDDVLELVRRLPDRDRTVTARDSWLPSYAASHEQDDENQQHEADAPTRTIAPIPAVPPRRQRPEEREDQDDKENRCKHQLPLR